ncbi:hypothetical protein COM97_27100 [Bacillus thuringiensis]|nr:hypothetical protein COM97_27100 [Bacillus thuringiensis]
MKIETIHDVIIKLRRKPNIRKFLRKYDLYLTKTEFANMCLDHEILVNDLPITCFDRLEDGVNVIQVTAGSAFFRVWTEVDNKKVFRSYVM